MVLWEFKKCSNVPQSKLVSLSLGSDFIVFLKWPKVVVKDSVVVKESRDLERERYRLLLRMSILFVSEEEDSNLNEKMPSELDSEESSALFV